VTGIKALFLVTKALFPGIRAFVTGIKALFTGIRALFPGIKAFVTGIKALFPGIRALFTGIRALFFVLNVLKMVHKSLFVVFFLMIGSIIMRYSKISDYQGF
jgi:hypothetical protein